MGYGIKVGWRFCFCTITAGIIMVNTLNSHTYNFRRKQGDVHRSIVPHHQFSGAGWKLMPPCEDCSATFLYWKVTLRT
jgi:hypothetical protein